MIGKLSKWLVFVLLTAPGTASLLCDNGEEDVCHKEADCGVHPSNEAKYLGVAWQDLVSVVNCESTQNELLKAIAHGRDSAQKTLVMTLDQVVVMVATRAGWKKPCHMHPSDAHMTVLQGRFAFKLHTSSNERILNEGDMFLVPKWHPHAERTHGSDAAVFVVRWTPIPQDKANLTVYVSEKQCDIDYLATPHLPSFDQTPSPKPPRIPEEWTATALVHPFSPPQTEYNNKDSPFTQLGIAELSYSSKVMAFNIHLQGCEGKMWNYKINSTATYIFEKQVWVKIEMGWSFPSTDWLGSNAIYVGSSPLNWMREDKPMEWWKQRHNVSSNWFWFDKTTGLPFRIMFGVPPPEISKGDKSKLAFFQMFSFSYIVNFNPGFLQMEELLKRNPIPDTGLVCGNPDSYSLFNWTSHFVMSVMMVPVDFGSDPLPTIVSYRWDSGEWKGTRNGRLQTTDMYYTYNKGKTGLVQTAALFGGWKDTKHKPDGYVLNSDTGAWAHTCERLVVQDVVIGQEPPWWPILGQAKIKAVIRKPSHAPPEWISPFTGTNSTVAIFGVLFPPHLPQYPISTYLWTWYDYTEYVQERGPARPITFMQSASTINEGTSLALADYFDYYQLGQDVFMHMGYLNDTLAKTCHKKMVGKAVEEELRGKPLGIHSLHGFFPAMKTSYIEEDAKAEYEEY